MPVVASLAGIDLGPLVEQQPALPRVWSNGVGVVRGVEQPVAVELRGRPGTPAPSQRSPAL